MIYRIRPHLYGSVILLTGDARLDRRNIWSSFKQRYKKPLEKRILPFIFQVPHHGSSRGFNHEIPRLISPSLSIVSYSIRRFFRLPNRKILGSLLGAGHIELCNENNPVRVSLYAYCRRVHSSRE